MSCWKLRSRNIVKEPLDTHGETIAGSGPKSCVVPSKGSRFLWFSWLLRCSSCLSLWDGIVQQNTRSQRTWQTSLISVLQLSSRISILRHFTAIYSPKQPKRRRGHKRSPRLVQWDYLPPSMKGVCLCTSKRPRSYPGLWDIGTIFCLFGQ